jgi:hypothetical protein
MRSTLGVEAVGLVAYEALPQLVVEGPGDSQLLAGCTHVAELLGSVEERKPEAVYLVFEGHRTSSSVPVSQQERRR